MNIISKCLSLLLVILLFAYGCRKDVEPIEAFYTYIDIHDYARDSMGLSINDTISGGIYIAFNSEGAGPKPLEGEKIYVYYNLRLLTGKHIQTYGKYSTDTTDIEIDELTGDTIKKILLPYSFKIGIANHIAGWDSAFYHIPRGSKATFLIPSEMAYGSSTSGSIPPNSPLRYDVELLWLKGDPGTEDDDGETESDPDGKIAKMIRLFEE